MLHTGSRSGVMDRRNVPTMAWWTTMPAEEAIGIRGSGATRATSVADRATASGGEPFGPTAVTSGIAGVRICVPNWRVLSVKRI